MLSYLKHKLPDTPKCQFKTPEYLVSNSCALSTPIVTVGHAKEAGYDPKLRR